MDDDVSKRVTLLIGESRLFAMVSRPVNLWSYCNGSAVEQGGFPDKMVKSRYELYNLGAIRPIYTVSFVITDSILETPALPAQA